MKEEKLFERYQNEIEELTIQHNKIAEDYKNYRIEFEKFIEYMIEIKGGLVHLNQQDFNVRMMELFGIVKDSYKNLLDLYGIAFANIQRINKLELYVQILFETLAENKDFSDIKNKIKKLERETKLLSDDGIKFVLQNLKDRMNEVEDERDGGKKID